MRIVVGVGVGLVVAGSVATAAPLDKPAFTATPAELLAEAKAALAGDAAVVVLRDELSASLDAHGRATRHFHTIFAIAKPAGIDGWGTIDFDWSPFYQDKPKIRARVIAPGGAVAELDPALITDAPTVSTSPSVFSDRRKLEAPLPRLGVGAVVEQDIEIADRQPLLEAGVVDSFGVGRGVPVQRTVITLDAPSARLPKISLRGFAKPPAPKQTTAAGRSSWRYELGPLPASPQFEAFTPGDVAQRAHIGFATGASWAAVAAEYRKVVEQRLADATGLPSLARGATERATAVTTLAWLHEHVRYTGIEFSDAAIVPWPPAETIKRGFGDCKDKATLLVALLRAAGLRADLAVLQTGPGLDVDRALPGLGDFDHAIVRAKLDGKDVWIDATEDLLPVGQLPARDQGRRALVIAADTKDLVMTPLSTPSENLIRVVRTFRVAENGKATLREVSTQAGVFFDDQRGWIRDGSHAEIEKELAGYVNDNHRGKLVRFTHDSPTDLGKPFALALDVEEVMNVKAGERQVDAYLFAAATFYRIPSLFLRTGAEADAMIEARRSDFEWLKPQVVEVENRLDIPTGFTMPVLIASETQTLGTMTLTTTRHIDGSSIVVTYRLDTGKRRLTPAELRATRKAVVELDARNGEHVIIPRTGEALFEQGKVKEAIAEYERLSALHPKEALHYAHLAEVYRRVGMGNAARRMASKASAVEPTSAVGFAYLGWELRHDTLGRFHGFDADRKGAAEAYRKALALDPKQYGALLGLADIVSTDEHWDPITSKRELVEAIALWRRAKELGADAEYDEKIVGSLLKIGDVDAAEKAARAMPDSEARSAALVTVAAVARSATDAASVAKSLASGDAYRRVVQQTVMWGFRERRYDVVRTFYPELAKPDPQFVAVLPRLVKIDTAKLDPADPKTPVVRALTAMSGRPVATPPWDAEVAEQIAKISGKIPEVRRLKQEMGRFGPTLDDLFAVMYPLRVEGSAVEGYRVAAEWGPAKVRMYVVVERGRAKLLGFTEAHSEVGARALDLLVKGNLAGASSLVRLVLDDLPRASLLGRLYHEEVTRVGNGPLSRDFVEFAAAIVSVSVAERRVQTLLPFLKRCTSSDPEAKKLCTTLLASGYGILRRWADAADAAHEAAKQDATNQNWPDLEAAALVELGRVAEAAGVVERALAKTPDSLPLLRSRMRVGSATGAWSEVRPWADKILTHAQATALDINNVAWAQLYLDSASAAKPLATRIVQMQAKPSANIENTLAAIDAELDHPKDAWAHALASLEDQNLLGNDDWYVIGRIAEGCGLRDDAIAAYKRVVAPQKPSAAPSGFGFAQRGLKRLGVR